MRPSSVVPQARKPSPGPTKRTPRSISVARTARVAAWRHMLSFIAGAITTGPGNASSSVETMLSARPPAALAMVLAVAGATTAMSAQRAYWMWSSAAVPRSPQRSIATGAPVSTSNVIGLTKRVAASVIAQRTEKPACTSRRAR